MKINKIDLDIINFLQVDGRMSCTEIAERIGNITERAVRYRLKRLTQEGVIQVTAIVHPKALGYNVVADVFVEVEPGHIDEVARQLLTYVPVTYVACSIGENDISLQVVGHSNEEIYRFVTEVVGRIPAVRRTNTSIVPVTLKDVYQWKVPEDTSVSEKV